MNRIFLSASLILGLGLLSSGPVFSGIGPEVEEALLERYEVTERNRLGTVIETGSVLVIQQRGIRAHRPKPLMRPTVVEAGRITKAGGGLLSGGDWVFTEGDRVHLYSFRVKKRGVDLILGTVEPHEVLVEGTSRRTPLQAAVHFSFLGIEDSLPEALLAEMDRWFLLETDVVAPTPKTIRLGQSLEEVVEMIGRPEKVVDLGEKVIYIYPDLKITFNNGHVADVE